jgi:hypothetical protein
LKIAISRSGVYLDLLNCGESIEVDGPLKEERNGNEMEMWKLRTFDTKKMIRSGALWIQFARLSTARISTPASKKKQRIFLISL